MKTKKLRKYWVAVSIIAAIAMLFTMTGVSLASSTQYGGDTNNDEGATVCVDGYVINHREEPVDGTELGLKVYAFGLPGTMSMAELPDYSAQDMTAEDLEAAAASADESGMMQTEGESAMTFVIKKVEVDEDGYFDFEDLPAGYYYSFAMALPADWDGLVPQAPRGGILWTGWTQLDERDDDDCYRIVFKIRRLFDVTVIKWEELQDGTVQPGEGWEITFTPQGDPFAVGQTQTTGEDGTAIFSCDEDQGACVTPGKWLITEKVKKGWKPVTPSHVYLTLDQYAPPGATDPVVFKNREPVCYGSIVVEKNGLGTDSETGDLIWLGPLAGWKIKLQYYNGAGYPMYGTTDASGKVTFDDLKPGVYKVTEKVQPGWEAVSENPQTVVIEDCETQRVLFENVEVVGQLQIHGKKLFRAWVPPYKGTKVGLSGWEITATLKGSDPERSITTYTNALGEYWFTTADLEAAGMAIPGATITVCEEERDHWIPVTATCVDVHFPYPVPVDYDGATVNFTNMQDPPLPGSASASTAVSSSGCQATHVVQRGENLSSIAAQYGTSVSAIARASGLSNPNYIQAGSAICVP